MLSYVTVIQLDSDMLYQKQNIDFTTKILEYQEIFHEEAVRKNFLLYNFHIMR